MIINADLLTRSQVGRKIFTTATKSKILGQRSSRSSQKSDAILKQRIIVSVFVCGRKSENMPCQFGGGLKTCSVF